MASKLRTGMVKAAAAGGASLEAFMHGDGWKSGAGELPATIAQSLSAEQARTLCSALCAIIASATDVMRGASGENLVAAAGAGVEDAGDEAAQSRAMNSVATIVSFMGAWAARAETPLPDAAFGRVMEALHMLIIDLPETKQGLALRTSIARLCETMWTQKRPFRNDIVGISLPVLIDDSLHPEAKDVNVRHVWAVREALDLIDFANEDSRGLAGAILTCYLRPLYTRTAENRRFLSYVMVHVPTLLPRIQEVVKAQLPYQPRLSDCFADVYFKAWQQAPDVSARTAIEQVCIQDLLHRGMHAQAPETFKSVTRFVHELVEHKKSKDVDAMLLRCMEPIIFRALQSANALVRKQAAIVFFDCFPLRDPDLPARDLEALLQRQFDAISALMQDASPAVREVAVKGVARVLNLYWEVIPTAAKKVLLDRLVDDAAADAASPAVRAAVPAALEYLLSQVLAHPLLVPVIPRAAVLLHDRTDKVRAAMVSCLLTLSEIKTLNVFELVDKDDVLARLVLDAGHPTIVSSIVKLLAPSFLVADGNKTELVKRFLLGFSAHEAAMIALLTHLKDAVPPAACAQIVLLLHAAIKSAIRTRDTRLAAAVHAPVGAAATASTQPVRGASKRTRAGHAKPTPAEAAVARSADAEVQATNQSMPPAAADIKLLDASNMRLMAAMLRGMAALWRSIAPTVSRSLRASAGRASDAEAALYQTLQRTFSGGEIADLLLALTGSTVSSSLALDLGDADMDVSEQEAAAADYRARITSALLNIAGLLPDTAVSDLPAALWSRLMAMSEAEAVASPTAVPNVLKCLTAWGRTADLLAAASACLQATVIAWLRPSAAPTRAQPGGAARSAGALQPRVAVRVLEYLLTECAELSAADPAVSDAMQALSTVMRACATWLPLGLAAVAGSDVVSSLTDATRATAAAVAVLAQEAASTWSRAALHHIATASDAVQERTLASVYFLHATQWVSSALLRAMLSFADAVDRATLSNEAASLLRPLEVACRVVVSNIASAVSDLVALGLCTSPAAAMFVALTSSDVMELRCDATDAGAASSGAGTEEGTRSASYTYSTISPVEWVAGDETVAASWIPAPGGAVMPVEYLTVLRLGTRLHAALHASSTSEAVLPETVRRDLVAGVVRLLGLAPNSMPESVRPRERAVRASSAATSDEESEADEVEACNAAVAAASAALVSHAVHGLLTDAARAVPSAASSASRRRGARGGRDGVAAAGAPLDMAVVTQYQDVFSTAVVEVELLLSDAAPWYAALQAGRGVTSIEQLQCAAGSALTAAAARSAEATIAGANAIATRLRLLSSMYGEQAVGYVMPLLGLASALLSALPHGVLATREACVLLSTVIKACTFVSHPAASAVLQQAEAQATAAARA